MENKIILKLEHPFTVLDSNEGAKLLKVASSITPLTLIKLLNVADNQINPRTAKSGPITKSIFETLSTSPELFWYKTKGILLATTQLRMLDRNRVEMTFGEPQFEGIMDGGHNTLAIANFITTKLLDFPLKDGNACKSFWRTNYEQIVKAYEESQKTDPNLFKFSIPVEILAPTHKDGAIDAYYDAIAEICAARNNNVQLTATAKGNQEGYYDYLKERLRNYSIIWKTNESGNIKSEDVITMADIPLMYLQSIGKIEADMKLSPVNLYSGKGQCVKYFGSVLSNEAYSTTVNGRTVLNNETIKSALNMTEDLMKYFDRLMLKFPDMYNSACRGRFGGISAVTTGKEMGTLFHTQTKKCACTFPPAFFYPLIAGTVSLMKFDESTGTVGWIANPASVDFDLDLVDLGRYTEMMKILVYNPNVIGKTALMYDLAKDAYHNFIEK